MDRKAKICVINTWKQICQIAASNLSTTSSKVVQMFLPGSDDQILGLSGLQDVGSLYDSEDELLNEMLKNKHVKHYRHLHYLATRHESSIMKLRFVLQPFSFVFLLSGDQQFHLVLETLDTEEATYLWHFDKDLSLLRERVALVDRDLQLIRNKGRQAFLANPPSNFSKIVHDYTDKRMGFTFS